MSDADPQDIFDNPPKAVVAIGDPLTSEQLDAAERITAIQDESWALHEVIGAWRQQQDSERDLRRSYATWMFGALLVESAVASTIIFLLGFSKITLDRWVADVFFVAVFGQVATCLVTITKYLFPIGAGEKLLVTLLERRNPERPKRKAKNA